MYAILALLGLGLIFTGFSGDDDDDVNESGGNGGDEGNDEPETFTSDDDFVVDQSYRSEFQDNIDGRVAMGQLTQQQGDQAMDVIKFRSGDINISTGNGDDYVMAGIGDDTIDAGTGDDFVSSGEGDDLVNLGEGDDTYGFEAGQFTDDETTLWYGEDEVEGGDDTVLGGAGDDMISDNYGSNVIFGHQGNDVIDVVDAETGAATPDTVDAGFGNDTINVDEGDTVTSNQGRDLISVNVVGGVEQDYDAVTVTDFNAAMDVIELEGTYGLLMPTSYGNPDTNPITVADMDDGLGAIVSINGVEVVHVYGGAGMTAANVRVSV